MKIKNILCNVVSDFLLNILSALISFIIRKTIVNLIGIELVGLNNIINQILLVLSISELGISSVISYYLYEPIKKKNQEKIISLMYLFKKLYIRVAIFIFGGGLLFLPFLSLFINDYTLNINYYYVYLLLLINTSSTYLFSYKLVFMEANQKKYKYFKLQIILKLLTFLTEIILFYITKNYYLYLILNCIDVIIINYILSKFVTKIYPFLKNNKNSLSKNEINPIKKDIKNMFISKISDVVTNASDTFILGLFTNVSIVGLYANYALILNFINNIIRNIIKNMRSSIANKVCCEEKEVSSNIFKVINFMTFILALFSSIGYFMLINFIIKIWIGEKYIMNNLIVICLSFELFILIFKNCLWQYTTIEGLFKIDKISAIIGCITNIILSIGLYFLFGVSGVIIATIISQIIQYLIKLFYLGKKLDFSIYKELKDILIYFLIYSIFMVISILLNKYINCILLFIGVSIIIFISIYIIYKDKYEFIELVNYFNIIVRRCSNAVKNKK